jgi:hypothetical protein
MKYYLPMSKRQMSLLRQLFEHEVLMLKDRITMESTEREQKEMICEEIQDLEDLLKKIEEFY